MTGSSLRQLIGTPGTPALAIAGLSEDSRLIQPGEAFIAIRGAAFDGHDYAAQAVDRGAACVLAERPLPGLGAPVVEVENLRARRGALAEEFYGAPSRALTCVGVTGTNGKTTIAHQLASLGKAAGLDAAYMGTIGWGRPSRLAPSRLTTEGAVLTHKRLACLRQQGCTWSALEVSSHALAQGRADAIAFDYAIFSNLTRDHLDYHADFEAYGAAKRRLFEFPSLRCALINIDDEFGRGLARSLAQVDVLTYGEGLADISWDGVEHRADGLKARLRTPWGSAWVAAPVCGDFGLANLAAAIGVLAAAGQPLAAVCEASSALPPVPGRMEFLRAAGRPTVVVDYAHTPDALAKALAAARRHAEGALVCVVGCGGDRDAGKRPMMGRIAAALADRVWLTSDNPRGEDPRAIMRDMAAGIEDASPVTLEVDRGAAIAAAIASADARDLVVVAGKGHEDTQEIGGRRHPFSDREAVRQALGLPGGDA
ncbi:MAG: UDP-N-acetylmuramoyl-L-alanyl-D-glutamate--2,6-diaminopimelate ligase [Gammaproteobacteria bacterium]|nr:UDP-N-acetylmuramoyl-L-alanyl-D-glutamate--2,6-diaminopimelate ligase [Gammaproteobacteria bacterium]